MEMRKIIVVESVKNRKVELTTNATTYGELKREMDAYGIEYQDMDAMVSPGKLTLTSNDSILPHDVPWKGTTTNNLVVMLTRTNKKISSGAYVSCRAEAYEECKRDKSLAEYVKNTCGKNYTNVSTQTLISCINNRSNVQIPVEQYSSNDEVSPVVETLDFILNALAEECIISNSDALKYRIKLGIDANKPYYSDLDIEEMFK